MYTSAPTAPPATILAILSVKKHVPRRISAMLPLRLLAAKGEQASPLSPSVVMSLRRAVSACAGVGPDPDQGGPLARLRLLRLDGGDPDVALTQHGPPPGLWS